MRFFWFFVVALALLMIPLPWSLLLVVIYASRYFAWDILLVAICIDGYFGIGLWPQYTVLIGAIILTMELVLPRLFYTR